MVRVIKYFETQVKVPIITEEEEQSSKNKNNKLEDEGHGLDQSQGPRVMRHREILPWFSKILDAVKMRYRKLQTFARYA
jgi:mitogen-activated protein kinase kinase kinase